MDINDLKAADYNPRVQLQPGMKEYEKLKNSLDEFGFVEPPVFNKRTGTLVGGHQRVQVAKDLGYTEVTVSVVDLTEAQEKALNVALNKISGTWDEEKLSELLQSLDDEMLGLTGFDDDELLDLLPESADDIEEDEFDMDAEVEEEHVTQEGDVWILGPHKLICGDSTKTETIENLMHNEVADLYITDPPYNVAYEGGTGLTIQNDDMGDDEFLTFLRSSFQAAAAKLKEGGAFYIWHADTESINFRTAALQAGLTVKQGLVWVKNALVMGRSDYHWRHEPCLYGWKEGATHYFVNDRTQDTVIEDARIRYQNMTKQELKDTIRDLIASGADGTVIREDKPSRSSEHPTMKPLKLMSRHIINSSRKGEIILDNFGGSGSTMMAAEQLGRKARTVELDPRYCDVIVKRYIRHVGGSEDVQLIRDGAAIDEKEWEYYLV